MAILLLFNSSDKLRLCDIMEHTKLSEPELKKQLQTLAETKIVIIEVSYLTVVWTTWTSKIYLEFIMWFLVCWMVGFMVLTANFNDISVISWQPVLLMEETGVVGENHRPVASH